MVAVVAAVNASAGGVAINPAIIACIGGGLGVVSTFFPLDSIVLIGYDKGWISMGEWLARGWAPTLILFVLSVVWLPSPAGSPSPSEAEVRRLDPLGPCVGKRVRRGKAVAFPRRPFLRQSEPSWG